MVVWKLNKMTLTHDSKLVGNVDRDVGVLTVRMSPAQGQQVRQLKVK